MRLATLTTENGTTAAVKTADGWRRLPYRSVGELLAEAAGELGDCAGRAGDLIASPSPARLLPAPRKIICAGVNFSEHIAEMGREKPDYPTLFAKFADTLTDPDATITLPPGHDVDWEAELAVVVGKPLHRGSREQALAAIAGYTVANDISLRDWQFRTLQWLQGKAWDATTPVGPELVTPDEFEPRDGARISCHVNGEQMQSDDVRTLEFDSGDLLACISTFTALVPGDLILTGTPGGVGSGRDPKIFLKDGDVVETAIEGIGRLRNVIRISG
jgi:acylpyruvate hydrolase